jgi:signal recognition particle subunit SRP54
MRKMGGMKGLMAMMPGIGKLKDQMKTANLDDGLLKRQEAIISSMTPEERRNPKVLHAKRKKRIAAGSGTSVQDVNKLLKQYEKMSDMMKKMNKMGKKGGISPDMLPPELGGTGEAGAGGMPGLGGPGMPSMPGGAGAKLPPGLFRGKR